MKEKESLIPMSASRIKVAKSCSWSYYCKYVLRLPEKVNLGAQVGGIVHEILETAFKEEDRDIFNFCKKEGSANNPYVVAEVFTRSSELGIESEENNKLIFSMIDNAFNHDFFGEENGIPITSKAEEDFDIVYETNNGKFRVLGFIDQLFVYKDRTLIRDFKTSKKIFSGADADDNLQDFIYNFAARQLFPETKKCNTEFLFLKFDLNKNGKLSMPNISSGECNAFSLELADWQRVIQNFDENASLSNLAARKDFPSDDSFSGPLMCGFAKKPGQLKKDGTLMYHCPFKFPFYFYSIVDENGNKVKTALEDDLEKLKKELKDGQAIKKFKYGGCPHFNKHNY